MLKGTRHSACEKTGKPLLFSLGIMSDTGLQAAAAAHLHSECSIYTAHDSFVCMVERKVWPAVQDCSPCLAYIHTYIHTAHETAEMLPMIKTAVHAWHTARDTADILPMMLLGCMIQHTLLLKFWFASSTTVLAVQDCSPCLAHCRCSFT